MSKDIFKKPFTIIELENRSDARGDLYEVLRLSETNVSKEGRLFFSTINQGMRRGDHYSKVREMWVTCVHGEVVVLLEDEDGNKTKVILSANQPKVVYYPPPTACAIYNEKEEPATLVFFASKEINPEDPDTYPKFIKYDGD